MKNGFTLIELLAVIVILAIIALIAVPIVLNIINDAKESSGLRSAEFYLDAVEYTIADAFLYHGGLEDKQYPITLEGDICKENETPCQEKNILKVEVNGEKPTGGYLEITDGTISDVELYLSNKVIVQTGDNEIKYLNPKSFSEDSWEVIAANVKAGNLSKYNVGDTKEISLTGFKNKETDSNGLYTIRIANTSILEECNAEGFSQTACGFVIEFEDIITTYSMNSTSTNVGGYPATSMYTYITNNIYNSFPQDLKELIIETKVVSSHGSTGGEKNFVSEDKAYLLSTKEVWGKEETSSIIYDTAKVETRQLDYYKNLGVTETNYSGAIKKHDGNVKNWWLRSARSSSTHSFYGVIGTGEWNSGNADSISGVSVAFRIG